MQIETAIKLLILAPSLAAAAYASTTPAGAIVGRWAAGACQRLARLGARLGGRVAAGFRALAARHARKVDALAWGVFETRARVKVFGGAALGGTNKGTFTARQAEIDWLGDCQCHGCANFEKGYPDTKLDPGEPDQCNFDPQKMMEDAWGGKPCPHFERKEYKPRATLAGLKERRELKP
jgi:hypothetical protein